jgi:type II secretory pathway pseudopilin PulG
MVLLYRSSLVSISLDRARSARGTTLVETLVALSILTLTVTSMMSAFTLLNREATVSRNQSSAKALCQQRIEQAMSLPFHPPAVLPSIDGFNLLGKASDWAGSSPPYTMGSKPDFQQSGQTVQTSTETVNVHVEQDGVTVRVPGTRTTTIACTDNVLNLAQFTVTVRYVFRSKTFNYQMYCLRASD